VATHYEVLGVPSTADRSEIRRSYHDAARQWHPDGFVDAAGPKAAEAEAEMRKVNEAWNVLGDAALRADYDRRLGSSEAAAKVRGSNIPKADADGVIRIDSRLLDPSYMASRRHAQMEKISNRNTMILRMVPLLVLVGLVVGIVVFTAYARNNDGGVTATTFPGPPLGEGIEAGVCVRVASGPSLIPRSCDVGADGQVIGARQPDGTCPLGTIREVTLLNGAIVCLG